MLYSSTTQYAKVSLRANSVIVGPEYRGAQEMVTLQSLPKFFRLLARKANVVINSTTINKANNNLSPQTLNMALEIQILASARHKNVYGLRWFM
jgi:hypothetical protein